jgi:hypothetical protein
MISAQDWQEVTVEGLLCIAFINFKQTSCKVLCEYGVLVCWTAAEAHEGVGEICLDCKSIEVFRIRATSHPSNIVFFLHPYLF